MKSVFFYSFGKINIGIAEEDNAVAGVFFGRKVPTGSPVGFPEGLSKTETPLIKKAAAQISEYLEGKRKKFDLPLVLHGTEFQKTVWRALQTIPYGETRSYKDIAVLAGSPKAFRAVGMANNRNPVSIIIPCHRVIGSNGDLVGYGGGLPVKKFLLELEGVKL
jgi:methylated-DNA-[protein]-cysteine S-methyltransferase